MRTPLAFAGLAAGLLLAGCDAGAPVADSPTARTAPAGGVANLVADGPGTPGHSHLVRIGEEWVVSTADPAREVFTLYVDPATMAYCGGSSDPEHSVQYNELDLVNGRMRNILDQGRQLPVYVYDFFTVEDMAGRTWCQYVAEEWKYRGTVDYTEQFHRNLIENNTAWQWNANGIVYDAAGNPYSFHESQHVVRPADGSVTWLKEDIIVTPRGN